MAQLKTYLYLAHTTTCPEVRAVEAENIEQAEGIAFDRQGYIRILRAGDRISGRSVYYGSHWENRERLDRTFRVVEKDDGTYLVEA